MDSAPSLAADRKPWRTGSETPFIRIRGVTKRFGPVTAVNDVTLDIYKNELFCLLGGSGCGKTTLLRMLAGFETPSAGVIEIDGQDMSAVPAHARPTNMMFQSYALFPHMSVEKNVGYGLKREGVAAGEISDRVAEMLKLVQLDGYGKRRPAQLSGGQRQRVALARALIKRPKLLLLDEPLGALDKKLREATQFELVKIQESLGITFVVVTHDQEEAMTLSTRIGVMNDGYIEQVGEPHEIYEYPQNRFVADFIGSVNMIEGTVVEDAPDHVVIDAQQVGQIHVSHGVSCTPNQRLWFAIRPEKLELSTERPDRRNAYRGKVEDIAYMGNQSIYLVKLEGGRMLRLVMANRDRQAEAEISWDDEVWVSWPSHSGVVLSS